MLPEINNLTNLSVEKLFGMFNYDLKARKHKVFFIDDLDEVSQKTANKIIEIVLSYREKYIKENKNNVEANPIHFVIASRPEAFTPTFRRSNLRDLEIPELLFPLVMPTYSSKYEIRVFYNNFLRERASSDIKLIGEKWRDDVIKLVNNEPYLKISLQSLDLGNRAFESILRQLKTEKDISKINHDELKNSLVSRLEERANEKHFRPTDTTGAYRYLIEDIAAEKWDKVASDGYFLVSSSDVQPITIGAKTGSVRIENALNRSGLATLDPADATEKRYRFEPIWLHRYYVEQHNKRIKKKLSECIYSASSSK